MKKKVLCTVLSICIIAALCITGCGSSSKKASSSASSAVSSATSSSDSSATAIKVNSHATSDELFDKNADYSKIKIGAMTTLTKDAAG